MRAFGRAEAREQIRRGREKKRGRKNGRTGDRSAVGRYRLGSYQVLLLLLLLTRAECGRTKEREMLNEVSNREGCEKTGNRLQRRCGCLHTARRQTDFRSDGGGGLRVDCEWTEGGGFLVKGVPASR